VLVVQSYSEAVRYGEEELAVLTFVSQQIAEAIELKRAEAARVEVLAQAQAARLEAEALRDASLALAKDLGLDAVLECLLDCLRRLVPYDSANVMLLEGGSRLAIRAVRGYEAWTDPEAVKAVEFDAKRNPVLRELVSTRRPVLVSDTTTHPGWEDKLETSYIRSWMGVPLVAGDRLIGLYSLDKALPAFFSAEHVRLAEGLAGSAARALRNAQLFEELRGKAAGRQPTKRKSAKKS
jgi:GAF domain-containing protein